MAPLQTRRASGAGVKPVSVVVADVNGDGKPDLIVSDAYSNNVGVLMGNGNGTFQAMQSFAAGMYSSSVAVADVNGDGKPDVIVTNQNDADVGVMLGTTAPSCRSRTFASLHVSCSIVVADMNGDGKADIVVVNNAGDVLLGNGNGTFQAQQTFATVVGSGPVSVAVADVNGDGKPDLIAANYSFATVGSNGTTVSVLLGNGDGTFQSPAFLAAGDDPFAIAVGNMSGDGVLDIIVSNESANTVTVLLRASTLGFRFAAGHQRGAAATTVVTVIYTGAARQSTCRRSTPVIYPSPVRPGALERDRDHFQRQRDDGDGPIHCGAPGGVFGQ